MIIEITDIRTPEKHPPASKPSVSGKAAIISRMAKMGQSILPKMPLPSTTDSEDTEVPYSQRRHCRLSLIKCPKKTCTILYNYSNLKEAMCHLVGGRASEISSSQTG